VLHQRPIAICVWTFWEFDPGAGDQHVSFVLATNHSMLRYTRRS